MNILFIGTAGVYHPLIAANLFTAKIEHAQYDKVQDLGNRRLESTGFPIYVGKDAKNNQVYSLGVGPDVNMVKKSIEQLVGLLGFNERDLLVKPVLMKHAGLILNLHRCCRFSLLRVICHPLILSLLKKEFPFLKQEVDSFKLQLFGDLS